MSDNGYNNHDSDNEDSGSRNQDHDDIKSEIPECLNDPQPEQLRKLFIGRMLPKTDQDTLRDYFSQFGTIAEVLVMKDKVGKSRCFGFVIFSCKEDVDNVQANRPHTIDGKVVETKRPTPREDAHIEGAEMTLKKIMVSKLKKDVTAEDLKDYFCQFGEVTDSAIVTKKESPQESRGFGFVTFDDYDPVDKIMLTRPHKINGDPVDVKKALSREQMEEIQNKKNKERESLRGYGGSSFGVRRGGLFDDPDFMTVAMLRSRGMSGSGFSGSGGFGASRNLFGLMGGGGMSGSNFGPMRGNNLGGFRRDYSSPYGGGSSSRFRR